MAISCPNCKQIFDDESSYKSHLPCTAATHGGKEDIQKSEYGEAVSDDTGER